MARKRLCNFNIDKLKLCYQQPQGLYKEFADLRQDQTIYRDGYDLYIIPDDDDRHIRLSVLVGGSLLGVLTLNNSRQCEGLCFFRFENKALYEFLTVDVCNGQKYNLISVWESIADDLGLVFNNVTEMEICCDCNFNLTAQIRKLITKHKEYDMILNGRKITDPNRKITDYHETFSRSRKRLIGTPTLYFEQSKTDAPLMRVYDKGQEIADKGNAKDYISDWNGFSDIYRTEVRLKSNSVKEFLASYRLDGYCHSILAMIQQQHFLSSAWQFFTDRLLRFREIATDTPITMADLAMAR